MTESKPHNDPFKTAQANQSVTRTWDPIKPPPITGVEVVDIKNVVYKSGVLTEIFRSEWFEDFPIRHIVHVSMLPGETTQWHCHKQQRDIIFPVRGQLRIGLYDSRPDSKTKGEGYVQNFNLHRPRYLIAPPGVWHSLRNMDLAAEAAYIVLNDIAYEYDSPDDWTLAKGAPEIPVSLD
ncbi:MAG: hypothetical protein AAFW74_12485 [Pseudomonadota bacterium]